MKKHNRASKPQGAAVQSKVAPYRSYMRDKLPIAAKAPASHAWEKPYSIAIESGCLASEPIVYVGNISILSEPFDASLEASGALSLR